MLSAHHHLHLHQLLYQLHRIRVFLGSLLLHLLFLHLLLKLLGKDEILDPGVLLLLYGRHLRFFNNLLLGRSLLWLGNKNRHLLKFFVRDEDRRFASWLGWMILVTFLRIAVSVPLAEIFGVHGRLLQFCLRKLVMLPLLSFFMCFTEPVLHPDSFLRLILL